MKYQLSKNYDLIIEGVDSENVTYLLQEDKKQKQYRINKTIYDVLLNLKNPLSKDECCKIILKEHYTSASKEVFNNLFSELIKNNIIIEFKNNKTKIVAIDIEFVEKKIEQDYILSDIIHDSSKSRVRKIMKDNKTYILKIHKFSSNKEFFQVSNEEKILRKIKKLNIAPIINHSSLDLHYIIIEYLDTYMSIKAYLQKAHRSIDDKIKISLNILKAYVKLFNMGVYHNDIHLSNIFVNENHEIKLLDFEHSFNHTDTLDKKINAAVNHYIPPERIGLSSFKKISSNTTLRSEVYQLGLIIYLIFKEKFPILGNTWSELRESIQNFRMYKAKDCYNDEIHTALYIFLSQAMKNNPNIRFKNVLEMYVSFKSYFYEKNF